MKKITILSILLGFAFFSCSPAPQVIGQQFSHQQKMEAAKHWEILAMDFSKQLSLHLEENPLTTIGAGHIVEGGPVTEKPYIYIQTNDRSAFGKTFRQSLVNELTRLGYSIAYRPDEALTLRWSVQKIRYDANRKISTTPGTYTTLGVIGYSMYKLIDHSSDFASTLAIGAIIDLADHFGDYIFEKQSPNSEINLALTVSRNGVLWARQSAIYYINDEDTSHYANIPDFEGQKEANLSGKIYPVVGN